MKRIKSVKLTNPKKTKASKNSKEFKKYLKEIESPYYPWVAKDLPENATPVEKAKYELCQKILGYQEDNNLTDEEISHRLGLNQEKTLQILFCWINKFTLDKLITYADKLIAPTKIQVVIRETRPYPTKTRSLYARKV